jgi:Ca-activated chloride channel family protein
MPEAPSSTFHLACPAALLLLLLLPLLALLRSRSGREGAVVFSSLRILDQLGPASKGRAGGFRAPLLFLALACVIVALSRPQWLERTETVSESGIEMILAIDVSRSMLAEDFQIGGTRVNRLQVAKKVAREFIEARESDRIGIVAFAGRPYLASPLTLSKEWLLGEQGLGRVQIGLVEDGTAIGSALAASAKRLEKRSAASKVIVLLTDGVNNAGKISPIEAARLAHTLGIRIYTVAVGTYGEYTVQTPIGPQRLRDEIDEAVLQEIADLAGGRFFRATDTQALERIFAEIDRLEKTEIQRRLFVEIDEHFHWFAMAGAFFALLCLVGDETFWRRFP